MKKLALTLSIIFAISNLSFAQTYKPQREIPKNKQIIDYKIIHWGFTVGFNKSYYDIYKSGNFLLNNDSMNVIGIEGHSIPGFMLGPVFNARLNKNFDFRFLLDITFTQRTLNYYFPDSTGNNIQKVKIPSTYIEMPILLKYKGQRRVNNRMYLIAGINPKFDFAALRKQDPAKPGLLTSPFDASIDIGGGIDFYLPYFKFSVELKYSAGLLNLVEIHNTIYSRPIEAMYANMFTLSFHFEG